MTNLEGQGSYEALTRRGRSLLWASNLDLSDKNDSNSDYRSLNSSGGGPVQPICPLFINQTESKRYLNVVWNLNYVPFINYTIILNNLKCNFVLHGFQICSPLYRLDSKLCRWIRSDPEHPLKPSLKHSKPLSGSEGSDHNKLLQEKNRDQPLRTTSNVPAMPSKFSGISDDLQEKRSST